MSVKYDLLKKLQSGITVSGQDFAKQKSVSRNSVWKAVQSLRKDGYIIDGLTNSGYKLIANPDTLTKENIYSHLKTEGVNIHLYESLDSTNSILKMMAQKGKPEKTVVIAKEQTAGKGRLGRKFESPKNTGVYMSILLRPKFSAENSLFITTVTAVAAAKAIEDLSGREVKIKWVNDLFIGDKKVCGILTEASINFETNGLEYAIVGIGINVIEPDGGFPSEIKSIAGSIFKSDAPRDIKSKIVARIIDEFFEIYNVLPDNSYIAEYRRRSYLNGKNIVLQVGNQSVSGTVIDVDDVARLVVKTETGEIKSFSAGEALINKNKE